MIYIYGATQNIVELNQTSETQEASSSYTGASLHSNFPQNDAQKKNPLYLVVVLGSVDSCS